MDMWIMEVKILQKPYEKNIKLWQAIRPTNNRPYKYNTKLEALKMLAMCYGEVLPEEKRVRNITEEEYNNIK
jgi:hypothetical protein